MGAARRCRGGGQRLQGGPSRAARLPAARASHERSGQRTARRPTLYSAPRLSGAATARQPASSRQAAGRPGARQDAGLWREPQPAAGRRGCQAGTPNTALLVVADLDGLAPAALACPTLHHAGSPCMQATERSASRAAAAGRGPQSRGRPPSPAATGSVLAGRMHAAGQSGAPGRTPGARRKKRRRIRRRPSARSACPRPSGWQCMQAPSAASASDARTCHIPEARPMRPERLHRSNAR